MGVPRPNASQGEKETNCKTKFQFYLPGPNNYVKKWPTLDISKWKYR